MAMRRTIFEPEHETFRDHARRFFQQEIGPHGERWREAGMVDRQAYLKAGEQGYLMMWADEQYGGAGVQDFRYEQILIEENLLSTNEANAAFDGNCGDHLCGHVDDPFRERRRCCNESEPDRVHSSRQKYAASPIRLPARHCRARRMSPIPPRVPLHLEASER